MKDQRFDMMLTAADKAALKKLAEAERLPAAAVVRRLIWAAATNAGQPAHANEVTR